MTLWGLSEKQHSLEKATTAILGNFWKNLGYFFFQHLVTLMRTALFARNRVISKYNHRFFAHLQYIEAILALALNFFCSD